MELNYEKIFQNGNFGQVLFEDDGEDLFVVVNDKIIYKNHGFDFVESYKNESLTSFTGSKIMVVANERVSSYKNFEKILNGLYKPFENPIIWKRQTIQNTKEEKSTKATLTLSEIKEKLGVNELTIICE